MLRRILTYKKIILVFFAAASLWGLMSFYTIPRQQDPDITLLFSRVVTTYPGASSEKVEKLVTKPLEEGFETITTSPTEEEQAWRKGIHSKCLFDNSG